MEDERLEKYFEICQRIYEQMRRDGTWPWDEDSRDSESVIDSEDTLNEL